MITDDPGLHARRRSQVLDAMPDRSALVVLSLEPARRNADVVFPYRPDSDLWYLSGFGEPACALVLTRGCDAPPATLFLRDRDPAREVWTGPRIGVAEAPERLGVDAAHDVADLARLLPPLLGRADTLIYRPPRPPTEESRAVQRALETVRSGPRGPHKGPTTTLDPTLVLHERRLLKDDVEVAAIRRANEVTAEALRHVMAACEPGTGEWEIQAALEATYRRRGAWGWAFPTIVAAGPNACVLHYEANHSTCARGDLLLIDTGAEVEGYAADVSRTFPVDGRFSAPQRDLYDVVLSAQRAVIDAVRPGTDLDALHAVAVRTLTDGLVHLGLLEGPVERAVEDGSYKRYYPHQTSHWLGLDVHDVGRYYLEGRPRPLAPGMVFTVEPGLYVPAGDEDVPDAFRGLGIRVENDVLVTAGGHEDLSADVPVAAEEIERIRGG